MSKDIQERDDVRAVYIVPWSESDGGLSYIVGYGEVTAIKIVARHGPMDWLPYVEVWKGDKLFAEAAQHNCLAVEFVA